MKARANGWWHPSFVDVTIPLNSIMEAEALMEFLSSLRENNTSQGIKVLNDSIDGIKQHIQEQESFKCGTEEFYLKRT